MTDQLDLAIDPDRPLVILDVDEVLALFFEGFGRFVAQHGYELRCERFALFANLYPAGGKETVAGEIGRTLFDDFFRAGGDLMDPSPGAPEALATLSREASLVILSNAPAHGRDERLRWLQRCAMDHPLIINSGPKGPVVAKLAARTASHVVFVDDIVSHLDSCLIDAPRVVRFQTVADKGLRPLAPTRPEHRRIDGWDALLPAIQTAISK